MVIAIGVDVNVGKGRSYDTETEAVKSFTFQKIDSSNLNTLKSLTREIKSFNLTKISHICITGCSNEREEALIEETFDSITPSIEFTVSNDFECEYLYLYGLLERRLQQNENFAVIRITDTDASAEMFKLVGDKLVLFRYYFAQAHSSMDSETAERLLSLVNSERYCKNFVIQYLSFKHKWMCQKVFKQANIVYTKPVDASRSAMLYAMMLAGIAKRIKVDVCSDSTCDTLPDATENGNIVLPKIPKIDSSFPLPQVFQEYIKRMGGAKRTSSRTTVFSPKHYLEKFTVERYTQYARKQLCRMRSESY